MDPIQVLIVEDDRGTAELFSVVLQLMGYECEIITNGRVALARLASAIPDLILLDIHLGSEITGEDILFQIRSNPRLIGTRVMVITAYPTVDSAVNGLADLVLMKPIDLDQLKSLAQRLISYDIRPKRFQFQDPLTELFNREFFMTRLALAFERARRRSDFLYAVQIIQCHHANFLQEKVDPDLNFAILREVAARLKSNLRPTDTIARISGCRFAVLNEDLTSPSDVHIIAKRLKGVLQKPYAYGSDQYEVIFNFSEVVHQVHFRDPEDVFGLAEQNLPLTDN